MHHVTATDLRNELFPRLKELLSLHQPLEVHSKAGDAVILPKADYEQLLLDATLYRLKKREANAASIPLDQALQEVAKILAQ